MIRLCLLILIYLCVNVSWNLFGTVSDLFGGRVCDLCCNLCGTVLEHVGAIWELSRNCCWTYLELLWNCFGTDLEQFGTCVIAFGSYFETVSEMFRYFVGTCLDVCWNGVGAFLKLFATCLELGWKCLRTCLELYSPLFYLIELHRPR